MDDERKWWYESHLGGVYSTEEQRNYRDLYCETCGDRDDEIGYMTAEEVVRSMAEYIAINKRDGGYDPDYIAENTGLTKKQIVKIVADERKKMRYAKKCYGKCKQCVWKLNGGCAVWNSFMDRSEENDNWER